MIGIITIPEPKIKQYIAFMGQSCTRFCPYQNREDNPLDYESFEDVISEGTYRARTGIIHGKRKIYYKMKKEGPSLDLAKGWG